MRTGNRGMGGRERKKSRKSYRNFTNTITQRGGMQELVFLNVWNSPRIPSPNSAAAILFLKDALSHPRMAHRREVPAQLSTDVCEKTESSAIQIIDAFLRISLSFSGLLGVEIQHNGIVNHVCPPWQLCHAESECPLLVRRRPLSLSSVSRPDFGPVVPYLRMNL